MRSGGQTDSCVHVGFCWVIHEQHSQYHMDGKPNSLHRSQMFECDTHGLYECLIIDIMSTSIHIPQTHPYHPYPTSPVNIHALNPTLQDTPPIIATHSTCGSPSYPSGLDSQKTDQNRASADVHTPIRPSHSAANNEHIVPVTMICAAVTVHSSGATELRIREDRYAVHVQSPNRLAQFT